MINKKSLTSSSGEVQTSFIEFIGPSGIGKTTFLNELVKFRGNDSSWLSNKEVQARYFRRSFYKKLENGFDYLLGRITQRDLIMEKLKISENDVSLIISLLYENLSLREGLSWRKVRTHDYVIHQVLNQVLLYCELSFSKIVLDEGLVHNIGIPTVMKDPKKYSKLKESKLFPVSVVSFTLEADIYKERILSRFKENKNRRINSLYDDMSDSELNEFISLTLKRSERKVEACKLIDIPVLEITSEITGSNLEKVNNFILKSDHQP